MHVLSVACALGRNLVNDTGFQCASAGPRDGLHRDVDLTVRCVVKVNELARSNLDWWQHQFLWRHVYSEHVNTQAAESGIAMFTTVLVHGHKSRIHESVIDWIPGCIDVLSKVLGTGSSAESKTIGRIKC
eukprot:3234798-Amphidinium_carterae.1